MDIVERLRDGICTYTSAFYGSGNVDLIKTNNMLKEAAAEIESLRAQTTWHRIDDPDNPPPKDGPHVRGLWVNVHEGCPYFQQDSGFIDYDTGRFLGYDGDDFGWDADDYTHWMPLPTPPEVE